MMTMVRRFDGLSICSPPTVTNVTMLDFMPYATGGDIDMGNQSGIAIGLELRWCQSSALNFAHRCDFRERPPN